MFFNLYLQDISKVADKTSIRKTKKNKKMETKIKEPRSAEDGFEQLARQFHGQVFVNKDPFHILPRLWHSADLCHYEIGASGPFVFLLKQIQFKDDQPILRGITQYGATVALQLKEFRPWFYIDFPEPDMKEEQQKAELALQFREFLFKQLNSMSRDDKASLSVQCEQRRSALPICEDDENERLFKPNPSKQTYLRISGTPICLRAVSRLLPDAVHYHESWPLETMVLTSLGLRYWEWVQVRRSSLRAADWNSAETARLCLSVPFSPSLSGISLCSSSLGPPPMMCALRTHVAYDVRTEREVGKQAEKQLRRRDIDLPDVTIGHASRLVDKYLGPDLTRLVLSWLICLDSCSFPPDPKSQCITAISAVYSTRVDSGPSVADVPTKKGVFRVHYVLGPVEPRPDAVVFQFDKHTQEDVRLWKALSTVEHSVLGVDTLVSFDGMTNLFPMEAWRSRSCFSTEGPPRVHSFNSSARVESFVYVPMPRIFSLDVSRVLLSITRPTDFRAHDFETMASVVLGDTCAVALLEPERVAWLSCQGPVARGALLDAMEHNQRIVSKMVTKMDSVPFLQSMARQYDCTLEDLLLHGATYRVRKLLYRRIIEDGWIMHLPTLQERASLLSEPPTIDSSPRKRVKSTSTQESKESSRNEEPLAVEAEDEEVEELKHRTRNAAPVLLDTRMSSSSVTVVQKEEAKKKQKKKQLNTKKVQGGNVIPPALLSMVRELILLDDFRSLYPSIIAAFNLCWSSSVLGEVDSIGVWFPAYGHNRTEAEQHYRIWTLEQHGPCPAWLKTETKTVILVHGRIGFVQKCDAILPRLLLDLLQQREQAKKQNETGFRQKLLKLVANSMYGFTLQPTDTNGFQCPFVGEMTTYIGRFLQAQVVKWASEWHMSTLYGDTDSVLLLAGCSDREEAKHKATAFCTMANSRFPEPVRLDLESILEGMKFLKAKKYIYLPLDGKRWLSKGMLSSKRDMSRWAGQVLDQVIQYMDDPKLALKYLEHHLSESITKGTRLSLMAKSLMIRFPETPPIHIPSPSGYVVHKKPVRSTWQSALLAKMAIQSPHTCLTEGVRIQYVVVRGKETESEREELFYAVRMGLEPFWPFYIKEIETDLFSLFSETEEVAQDEIQAVLARSLALASSE